MVATGGKSNHKKTVKRPKKAGSKKKKKKSSGAKTLSQKRAVVARSNDRVAKRMLNKATQKAYSHARKHAAVKKKKSVKRK